MKKLTIILIGIFIFAGTAHAGDIEYLTKSVDQINAKMTAMQNQIDELKSINNKLQSQIDFIPERIQTYQGTNEDPQIQALTVRTDAIEKKVGILETAISFLQDKVIALLNTTIGLLKQILKI